MKPLILFISFFLSQGFANAQFGPTSLVGEGNNIYALIMGVSSYDNPELKLNYADDDAKYFYNFLLSKSGGNVPVSNIQFLLNEEATIANFYVAFRKIDSLVSEGDLVYIYFSGHGGYSGSNYKNGFLYAHDTPKRSFMENAIRVLELNDMVNDWSLEKNVKAHVILDACNSGSLRENDRGQNLGAMDRDNLNEKQVRISSSGIEQESEESSRWGGGRGIFSYHLIRGLQGLADKPRRGEDEGDGVIVLSELEMFIKENVKYDLEDLGLVQTPEFNGNEDALVAIVDTATLDSIKNLPLQAEPAGELIVSSRGTQLSPPKAFIKDQLDSIINKFDFKTFESQTSKEIALAVFNKFKDDFAPIKENQKEWKKNLPVNNSLLYEFQQDLAAHLHNEVQLVLNKYLDGDRDEMERRQYYNADKNLYDEYIDVLVVAEKLINPKNDLLRIIKMKKYFFSGIIKRFKARLITSDTHAVKLQLNEAILDQKQALNLSDEAAYVHNELGVLNNLLNKPEEAKRYYEKALELVSDWSIPLSNLSSYYFNKKQYDKSLEYAKRAMEHNGEYYLGLINYSRSLMAKKDLLTAKDALLKAKKINDSHYIAYELLGDIYTEEGRYTAADTNYLAADIRKRDWIDSPFAKVGQRPFLDLTDDDGDEVILLPDDTTDIGEMDFIPLLVMGRVNLKRGKLKRAAYYFDKVIKIKKDDPLVYRYYGELLWRQGMWERAEMSFKLAKIYKLDGFKFTQFYEKESRKQDYQFLNSMYLRFQYDRKQLDYFLADLYTQWKYYGDAESIYKDLIQAEPLKYRPNYLFWRLLENQGAYDEAEEVITAYNNLGGSSGFTSLAAFYKRMIERKIEAKRYHFKLGNLLYKKVIDEGMDQDVEDAYPSLESNLLKLPNPIIIDIDTFMGKEVIFPPDLRSFYLDAIDHLEQAIVELDTLKAVRIYAMLGDLKMYYGDHESAASYYNKAVDMKSDIASYLNDAIHENVESNHFVKAVEYLQIMSSQNQLNFKNRLILAHYKSMLGAYDKALSLLGAIDVKFVHSNFEGDEILARTHYFKKDFDSSEKAYGSLIKENRTKKADYQYAMARIYAQKGNSKKAIKYIKKAINWGWNYLWILEYDPVMEATRKHSKWDDLPKAERS